MAGALRIARALTRRSEAAGLSHADLIGRIIELALHRADKP